MLRSMAAVNFIRFLSKICIASCLVIFTSCASGLIDEPKFSYVDLYLVKITYTKGANRTLYVCCQTLFPDDMWLSWASCGEISMCPSYETPSHCVTSGRQVCCEADRIQENVTLSGYLGWLDGEERIRLSETATYITSKSERVPKPVSKINVTTNRKQGLDITWTPLSEYDRFHTTKYEYRIHCRPWENLRAKAFVEHVETTSSPSLVISSQNITAVTQYQCCVQVENLVNSRSSQKQCQNVTTTENAPSEGPKIICGNGTIQCPSVINGAKRDIEILFEPPSAIHRNGVIQYHIVYSKSTTSDNFTKLEVVNASLTEAVISDLETGTAYDVFMTSCTTVGCSPPSNTVHLAAVSYIGVFIMVVSIVSTVVGVALILTSLVYMVKRRQRLRRAAMLPKLTPETNSAYQYPALSNEDDYNCLYPEQRETCKSDQSNNSLVQGSEDIILSNSNLSVVET